MSPPWEQMQFVSNLISSKLFFFSFPQWPMGMALMGERVVRFHTERQKVGIHCHHHSSVKEQYLTLYRYPHLVWRRDAGRQVNICIMKIEIQNYQQRSH